MNRKRENYRKWKRGEIERNEDVIFIGMWTYMERC